MANGVELIQLDAFGASGPYRTLSREPVVTVTGEPIAELSVVPVAYISRTMNALKKAHSLPLPGRLAAMAAASEIFRSGVVNGLSRDEYELTVSRVSGLSISTVRSATDRIADFCRDAHDHAQSGRPRGTSLDWRDQAAASGTGLWTRRGDVFGVHAAGNHPAVHANWLEILALGFRVAVRPSRREPFTPNRLIMALHTAGYPSDNLVLLPSDYEGADEMLRGADLSMAYGGDDVMRKYSARPDVLPQGPGRSKILITADTDWREHVDLIADSVSNGGGVGCTNTTAVLVDGDAAALAEAVAERLGALPSLPPVDERAILPVLPVEMATKIGQHLQKVAMGATPVLAGIVHEFGDGSAALRPAVHLLPDAGAPQLRTELGFPCVWIAPWSPEDGIAPLRDTLALTVMSSDEGLIDALLAERTIRNVYIGAYPTYWNAPGRPHDGYLTDFLMESKSVVR